MKLNRYLPVLFLLFVALSFYSNASAQAKKSVSPKKTVTVPSLNEEQKIFLAQVISVAERAESAYSIGMSGQLGASFLALEGGSFSDEVRNLLGLRLECEILPEHLSSQVKNLRNSYRQWNDFFELADSGLKSMT